MQIDEEPVHHVRGSILNKSIQQIKRIRFLILRILVFYSREMGQATKYAAPLLAVLAGLGADLINARGELD